MRTNNQRTSWKKDRTQFLSVLGSWSEDLRDDTDLRVLVLGGSEDDLEVLRRVGFHRISLSDLNAAPDVGKSTCSGTELFALDAEAIELGDDSYDLIFAHEVLHHCRSPHRALCEMLRVSKRYVLFLEPNDSLLMRSLVRMRLSFPYELPAVVHHGGKTGGVRNSQIPNYIYRWNRSDIFKTVASFLPERFFSVTSYPYWDVNTDEYDLSLRTNTRIGFFTSAIGPRNFLRLLRFIGRLLNLMPFARAQGNKHFCVIEKRPELQPWLRRENGRIVFAGNRKPSEEIMRPGEA